MIKTKLKYHKRILRNLIRDFRDPIFAAYRKKNIFLHGHPNGWYPEFILKRICGNKRSSKSIACISVNTFPAFLHYSNAEVKIFHTAENTHVHLSHWEQFDRIYEHEKSLSLSIGFDFSDNPKHIRFPFWITWCFEPTAQKSDIVTFVDKYRFAETNERDKFCAFICRTDYFGDRALLADAVERIAPLNYPSGFRHNDDTLKTKYSDNKIAYLRSFKFILCPENSNNKGYVTEKIFDAVRAGCVPIYWGNEGAPEPEILNQEAIIFIDVNNPQPGINKIRFLNEHPEEYQRFASQPRFMPDAEEKIWTYFEILEKKIRSLLT